LIPRDIFLGVLYSNCNKTISVFRSEDTNFGYKIRFSISIRGADFFLKILQERLTYENIKSNLVISESKTRPRPILKITELFNLTKLLELINSHTYLNPETNPEFAKGSWIGFNEALLIMLDKKHYTDTGFNRILEIKKEVGL
jgi:hypothetical protein|tara:strand:- start:4488 stop:4916 length:429 start_codon:yes stop_codon:yes gene_type:complete